MGDYETGAPASVESTVEYHPYESGILTITFNQGVGPWQAGSLTGAVASKNVTEASKGSLSVFGNHATSVKA